MRDVFSFLKTASFRWAVFLFLTFLSSCNTPAEKAEMVAEPTPEPQYLFDIQIDSLEVIQNRIGKNQFLTDILMQYNVDYASIEYLAKNFRSTFDVKRIRAGNNYFVMLGNDSLRKPQYFVYEISTSDY
ncbi:MAG: hypothetical protein IT219_07590, partial [Bacteroidales bacterium]|nr:hypothetical protein [Bacteroidales bacterium]